MVRREEHERRPPATLILDARRCAFGLGPDRAGSATFEWAISTTASVGAHLLAAHRPVRLVHADGSAHLLRGSHSTAALLVVLAQLVPTGDAHSGCGGCRHAGGRLGARVPGPCRRHRRGVPVRAAGSGRPSGQGRGADRGTGCAAASTGGSAPVAPGRLDRAGWRARNAARLAVGAAGRRGGARPDAVCEAGTGVGRPCYRLAGCIRRGPAAPRRLGRIRHSVAGRPRPPSGCTLMAPRVPGPVMATLAVLGASTSLASVFADARWIWPVAGAAILASACGAAVRRWPLPVMVAGLLPATAFVIYVTAVFARQTAVLGFVPTGRTWGALRAILQEAAADIRVLVAPVPAKPGLVLLTVTAVFTVAGVVDILVTFLGRPALAGFPLLALFAVPAHAGPPPAGPGRVRGGSSRLCGSPAGAAPAGRRAAPRWGWPPRAAGNGGRAHRERRRSGRVGGYTGTARAAQRRSSTCRIHRHLPGDGGANGLAGVGTAAFRFGVGRPVG